MKTQAIDRIPLSELRVALPKIRRKVQLGGRWFLITHYAEPIAYLLPLSAIEGLSIDRSSSMSLIQFRTEMTIAREALLSGQDCVYITFHDRPVCAFIGAIVAEKLSLPEVKTYAS